MDECLESLKEPLAPEEIAVIKSAIYLSQFLSAWITEQIPILEQLIKINDFKDSTAAFKAGQKTAEEGIQTKVNIAK